MSAATVEESKDTTMMLCASCGTAGGDDIKLMKCTACHLARYCSIKCQKDHWPKHKKECKKRAAKLRDEILFKQPESNHYGDCPICCLPLPLDPMKLCLTPCCSKYICIGCDYANKMRENERRLKHKCAFCREVLATTKEGITELLMKRIEANDPVTMREAGLRKHKEGDYNAAFEYLTRAAALGDVGAHCELSVLYRLGKGVETDEKKELYHAEQAAIGGHPVARHNLGCYEWKNNRMDRAAKHIIIAANLGDDDALAALKDLYKAGHVSKDDFAATLRGHKAAVDATKSPQREKAAVYYKEYMF